jgi:hypothetical protein
VIQQRRNLDAHWWRPKVDFDVFGRLRDRQFGVRAGMTALWHLADPVDPLTCAFIWSHAADADIFCGACCMVVWASLFGCSSLLRIRTRRFPNLGLYP